MTSKRNLKKSNRRRERDTINRRFGMPLLALLLVAAASLSQASSDVTRRVNEKYANSYTLHFINAKRSGTTHSYSFGGYLNYANGTAERVGMDVKGTYYGSSGLAVEIVSFNGSYGSYSATTTWGCTDDPWLSAQAKCSQERANPSGSAPTYLWAFCPDSLVGHYCFASNNMAPKAMVKLMRHGPPAPTTNGPAHATDQDKVKLTVDYAKGVANRVLIQQWYCSPGKENAPTNTPGDLSPFGAGCTSTVTKPLKISPAGTHAAFMMAYPQSEPKAGIWYVRTRLGSDSYGDSVWGDWHRTMVAAIHFRRGHQHVSLSPNVKIKGFGAPRIMAPKEGQVFHGGPLAYDFSLAPHTPYSDWSCCSIQWKRAIILTKENKAYAQAHTPGQTAFPTPPMPWHGPGLGHTAQENSPVFDGGFPDNQFGPRDPTFGYRYWFRIREQYMPGKEDGPWSAWRSFVVQAPVVAAAPYRGGVKMGVGTHMAAPSSGQQHGQDSQQRALRPSNVRIGSAVPHLPAVQQPAPAMHTMSGSLNSPKAPTRDAGMGLHRSGTTLHRAPRLRVLSHVGTVDPGCANLGGFITIRETLVNDGGPLAAGRARLYVKEGGGAHISSRAVPVPALAHGAMTTLTIRAGTRESFRGKVPGRHVLPVFVVVNGETMRTNVVEGLRPNLCQVHRQAAHPLRGMPSVKLNPQPEPPSAPPRLTVPRKLN